MDEIRISAEFKKCYDEVQALHHLPIDVKTKIEMMHIRYQDWYSKCYDIE